MVLDVVDNLLFDFELHFELVFLVPLFLKAIENIFETCLLAEILIILDNLGVLQIVDEGLWSSALSVELDERVRHRVRWRAANLFNRTLYGETPTLILLPRILYLIQFLLPVDHLVLTIWLFVHIDVKLRISKGAYGVQRIDIKLTYR